MIGFDLQVRRILADQHVDASYAFVGRTRLRPASKEWFHLAGVVGSLHVVGNRWNGIDHNLEHVLRDAVDLLHLLRRLLDGRLGEEFGLIVDLRLGGLEGGRENESVRQKRQQQEPAGTQHENAPYEVDTGRARAACLPAGHETMVPGVKPCRPRYSYSARGRWQACRVEDLDPHALDPPPRGVQNRDA